MTEPIRVWRFADAPQEFQNLSGHGGDEDWIAHVPVNYAQDYIPWLRKHGDFGCCDVSEHILPDGSIIYIGAHA